MADYTLSARIVGDASSLNKSVNKANSVLSEFKKGANDTSKQSSKAFNQISKDGEKLSNNIKKTWSELSKETGKSIQELKKQAESLAKTYQSQGVNIPLSYKKAYADLGVDIRKSKNELQEFEKTGSKATQGLNTNFSSLKSKITGLIASLGLMKITIQGITSSTELETKLSKVSTMFGNVNVDTKNLRKKLLDLGVQTGLSANELSEGLYNALSAGIPVTQDMSESLEFLKTSTMLAKGGFTSTEKSVDALTTVLNGYKMKTSEANKVSDMLLMTQNKGKTTVDELAGSLANVTPTAAAMNVQFEQVSASLATMTAQGIPTAQSTTMLNQLFAELGKEGQQASKNLALATQNTKYAGMSFQDMMKKGVPLNEVLNLMSKYANENGLSLLDMFGSIEAGKSVLALSGQNAQMYANNLDAMKNSSGATKDASDKMNDTLAVQFDRLKAVANSTLISFFDKLKPAISKVLDVSINFLSNLEEYKPILEPIAWTLGVLATAFIAYNLQAGIATGITTALAGAFAFLTSPITLIIVAIALLVAGIMHLWKTNETFRNIVIEAWTSIQATLSNIWNNILKPIFQEITRIVMDIWNNGIKPLWDKIQEFVVFFVGVLSELWNKIAPFVNMFVDKFGGVIVQVVQSVARAFGNSIKNIMSLLGSWLDNIKQVISGVKKVFTGIIDFITGVFKGNWKQAWQGIVDIFKGIFETIGGLVKMPLNAVVGAVNGIISRLNGISIDIPDWVPGLGGKHFGVNIPTIPYLKRGTNNFEGGFARINEGGRGELVNLPNGTQVIPHDISIKYAKESARINSNYTSDIDYNKIGEYVVKSSGIYAQKLADGIEKGIAKIKVVSNNRETARFMVDLGFVRG